MLPVVWTEAADEDLATIIEYVFERDPIAARGLWERLKVSAVSLSEHPYLFKESDRMPGYREIVAHPNYLVFTGCWPTACRSRWWPMPGALIP